MTHRVVVEGPARDDLVEIERWLIERASPEAAQAYTARLIGRVATLEQFPLRGTPHPEIGEGVRSMPFERRIIVFYRVETERVAVLRVISAARDLQSVAIE